MDTKSKRCTLIFLSTLSLFSTLKLVRGQPTPCIQRIGIDNTINLECTVYQGQYVDYRVIRKLTESRSTKYSVLINCEGGLVYLPWPYRAKNVVSLSVRGCEIEGYMSENFVPQTLPDELKEVSVVDCKLKISVKELYDSLVNIRKMTKAYECGQTHASIHIFRNIEYKFPNPTNSQEEKLLMEQLLAVDRLKEFVTTGSVCRYPNLEYMETSGSRSISSIHFKLVEIGQYPELKTYSVRNNSLFRIPPELQNLKLGFLPKLTKLDLSNNMISDVNLIISRSAQAQKILHVDLSGNNIHHISRKLLEQLESSNSVILDLRQNPLMCTCDLDFYRSYLERMAVNDMSILNYSDFNCFSMENGRAVLHSMATNRSVSEELFWDMLCPI